MHLNEYQNAAGVFDGDQPLEYYPLGLCGEAGEVAEPIKKAAFHGKALDAGAVALELGDCLWYLARCAAKLGYTLEEIGVLNIEKLTARHARRVEKTLVPEVE